jgi:lipid-A-disaccharide synthase
VKGDYVALLPGSRKQEIKSVLRQFAELADNMPSINFIVAGISSIGSQSYEIIEQKSNVSIVYDATYSILSQANAAIVVSGTATFETALFNIPQVVVYKTSWLTYFLAKLVLRIKYISLVNLVADKQVVKELIQHDFSVNNLRKELTAILTNKSVKEQILLDYSKIKEALGEPNASDVAADEIGNFLKLS